MLMLPVFLMVTMTAIMILINGDMLTIMTVMLYLDECNGVCWHFNTIIATLHIYIYIYTCVCIYIYIYTCIHLYCDATLIGRPSNQQTATLTKPREFENPRRPAIFDQFKFFVYFIKEQEGEEGPEEEEEEVEEGIAPARDDSDSVAFFGYSAEGGAVGGGCSGLG